MHELLRVILFYVVALATVGSAVGVAVSRDIVRAAFFLLSTLLTTAGLFFLADAMLLAVIQILVYAGGTMVLIVFGVMLTSPRLQPLLTIRPMERTFALAVCLSLLAVLIWGMFHLHPGQPTRSTPFAALPEGESAKITVVDQNRPATPASKQDSHSGMMLLASALVGLRLDAPEDLKPGVRRVITPYVLVFEIVSFHLLVALIAAAYLARPRRPTTAIAQGNPHLESPSHVETPKF
jgi:NADH-quinone oxidoreductase subunit J